MTIVQNSRPDCVVVAGFNIVIEEDAEVMPVQFVSFKPSL